MRPTGKKVVERVMKNIHLSRQDRGGDKRGKRRVSKWWSQEKYDILGLSRRVNV